MNRSGRRGALAAVLALLFAHPAAAGAATIAVPLPERGVVWVSDPSRPQPPQTVIPTMTNSAKTFVPDLLVIPAGGSVRFPNDDPFYHSVYSTSPIDPFDIGFYDTGPGKTIDFPNPGVVEVHCHIHAMMRATIVVVDGPWALGAGPGIVNVGGVRAGSHAVHEWTLDAGERVQQIDVAGDSSRIVVTF